MFKSRGLHGAIFLLETTKKARAMDCFSFDKSDVYIARSTCLIFREIHFPQACDAVSNAVPVVFHSSRPDVSRVSCTDPGSVRRVK